jgi:hypothetical protein
MTVTTELQVKGGKQGDELLIHDVWGAIEYKGEGVHCRRCWCYRSLQFLGNYKLKTNNKLILLIRPQTI